MELIKKHYEKVILAVVLLGLVVGAVFLTLKVPAERRELQDKEAAIVNRPPKPLAAIDLSAPEAMLQSFRSQLTIDLATTNKLVNPMVWRKRSDGAPIKDTPRNIGPEAIVVLSNRPLYLTLTFDSVNMTGPTPRYVIGVQREAAPKAGDRGKKQREAGLNVKNDTFVIREVKGPADAPTELVLELVDTGETAVVTRDKDKPYRRIDGYEADMRYAPENKMLMKQRVGSLPFRIEGEEYKIVAISKNEVILSAPNNKKTSIPYSAAQ